MMNICICTDLWLGTQSGAVDRIVKLARNVSKHGATIYLVDRSRKKSFSALLFDNDKYYGVKNGIFKEFYYPFYMKFLFPGIIKFLQEILNKMLSLLTRTVESEVSLFYAIDPYLAVKLFFICKKEKIDLIQCEFPTTTFPSFIVKKVLGIPLIYDAHNIESERLRSMTNINQLYVNITKLIETISCRICDSVLVVSEEDKEQLLSWNIPRNKIRVIPNSVETDKFSPVIEGSKIRKKYELNNKIVIIFHGILNYPPNKEAAEILINNILPCILKEYPNVYLLLVGRNPPKTSHPNIVIAGFVENLPEYIAAADIAVVPLLRGGGTKIKMLEYMACGKAVVSTIKGAEGLDLKNGREILISEYPNSEFIDLVFRLIEDRNLRKNMGINARKKVELLYDWEKTAKKAISIYGNLTSMHEKK
jgi:glycosyltransferase involved in cell wall biosynthesis